ncbi:MAG TPA: UrcA family protein [Sphingomicrobium sp.]|jgi:UrcA family protein|nr:UrcA family protein [Sphingomicrobium sp.]
MTKALKIAFTAFVITAGIIKGAPALAETPQINVSYVHTADLDLSTTTGQRQLEARLSQAAREVCGAASDVDLEGKNDVRACRVEVLARVHANSGLLAAANRGAIVAITAAR